MSYLYHYIIFPGFLFSSFCGMLASFIDRKITARLQWRKGPPLFQPLYDFIKLLGKETVIPYGVSRSLFLLSPLVGLSAIVFVSTILWLGLLYSKGFAGDI
ncbi:MAG: NADH-quinone oxidoreductase subunit H, partial [Endomicrobiia bacterium]